MLGDGLKKPLLLTYTIMLFILLMQILAPMAVSDAELPEWSIGDSWNYKSPIVEVPANFTMEVKDITTVNVNGTDYEVYVVENIIEFPIEDIIITNTINNYILRDELSTVKTELIQPGPNNSIRITVTIFDPPKKDYNYPLTVGKEWNSKFFESVHEEELGYFNTTRDFKYKVVGEEPVTVEAGTFDCYKIEIDIGFVNPTIAWYSPEVENVVKTTGRQAEMGIPMELTHYTHDDNGDDGGETSPSKTPYLLLLFLIPIIVILFVGLLVMRKGRKKKKRRKKKRKSKGKKKKKKK